MIVTGVDGKGTYFNSLPNYESSQVAPDPTNEGTTDFPRKGCKVCGKRDRPQYKGTCNDDNCCYWNTLTEATP